MTQSIIGTHWVQRIWTVGEEVLYCHMFCQEFPQLNTIFGGPFGKEMEKVHPVFGFGGVNRVSYGEVR